MFFISRRPVNEHEDRLNDWDIWYADRTETGWKKPVNPGAPVNTDELEIHPSVIADGTLYFSSGRKGGMGRDDIYRSRYIKGRFMEPENLGNAINTEYGEGDIFIAPDESYIIFSSGRPGGFGRNDLYISFQKKDGSWITAVNMGEKINSPEVEYCPSVSPDGKYFFFTSYRRPEKAFPEQPITYNDIIRINNEPLNGSGNIYWINTEIINQIKNTLYKQ